jgi:hypothetical protein
MKITKEFVEKIRACNQCKKWAEENNYYDLKAVDFLNKLIESDKLDWANWLIVRVMERKQYLAYAIFAAEQVIDIYEAKCPDNKKPREAIEAAKKVLKNDTQGNRAAANVAANAADVAYVAAYDVANVAANAANVAAYVAAYVAANDAANDAANVAANAADVAYVAAYDAAKKEMRLKILNYGLELIKEQEK